jgi:hypothetical protein
MRTYLLLTALCVVLAAPSLARPDLPPPPALQQADARCESLNNALRRLARQENVPVRLVYANIGFVEITIPKAHASAADRAGITALGNDELRFRSVESESSHPARLVVAGIAISLGVILAGIFLARRKYLIAMTIALASFVLVAIAAVVCMLWQHNPIEDASEKKVAIVVRNAETGPVRVTIPLSLRPAGYTVEIIDNYGDRPPRPRPDGDKK